MKMGKENHTEKTAIAKILAITLLLFAGCAAAGSVIIQDGQISTGNATTPLRPMHIAASQDANLRLQDTSGSGPAAYVEFFNDTTRWGYVGLGGHTDKMTIGTTVDKDLSFYTNSVSKMLLTSAGNLGIGTTSPGSKLHINGTTVAQGEGFWAVGSTATYAAGVHTTRLLTDGTDTYFKDTYLGGAAGTYGKIRFQTSDLDRLTILANGNVGIGTTSPGYPLTINNNGTSLAGTAYSSTLVANAAQTLGIHLGYDSSNGAVIASAGIAKPISFWTYASPSGPYAERIRIDATGNVGIGTTSPIGNLQIDNAISTNKNALIINQLDTAYFAQDVATAGVGLRIRPSGTPTATNAMLAVDSSTGQGNLFKVQYNGNVGIGTTNPQGKLEVAVDSGLVRLSSSGTNYNGIEFYGGGVQKGAIGYAGSASNFGAQTSAGDIAIMSKGTNLHFETGTGNSNTLMFLGANGGNVGIGTTSPGGKLSVFNDASDLIVKLQDTRTSTSGDYLTKQAFYDYNGEAAYIGARHNYYFSATPRALVFGVSGNEYMRISNSGYVGIGTTNVGNVLTLNRASTYAMEYDLAGAAKAMIGIPSNANDLATGSASGDLIIRGQGNNILFTTDSGTTTQMYLKNGGNVGIGTASPQSKLHVSSSLNGQQVLVNVSNTNTGASAFGEMRVSGDQDYLRIGTTSRAYSGWTGDSFIYASAGKKLRFGANDTEIMTLSSGKVGINTTSPETMLDIQSTAPTIRFHYPGNSGSSYIGGNANNDIVMSATSSGANIIMTTGTGKVGIGTTSPGYTLTVNGTAWVTSGTWTGSDARWKGKVVSLSPSGSLDKVLALRPVSFEWKNNTGMNFPNGTQVGFIAQEVEKIIPEVVTADNSGYKGISYEKMVPVVAGAIQEQQRQIDSQKEQIEKLKTIVCIDHPQADACK